MEKRLIRRKTHSPLEKEGMRDAAIPTRDKIYESILDAVVGHRILPGTRLPEDQLAKLYGVSRTIIRLALQKLEFEGVITAARNRSPQVSTPTADEANQIFEARLVVETAIIRKLCGALSTDEINELKNLLKAEHDAFERGDGKTSIKLSGEFHIRMAELAGNPVLTQFLHQLVSRTSLILAVFGKNIHSICAADEHEELLSVIESGDVEAADRELKRHFKAIQSRIQLGKLNDKTVDLAAALRL